MSNEYANVILNKSWQQKTGGDLLHYRFLYFRKWFNSMIFYPVILPRKAIF